MALSWRERVLGLRGTWRVLLRAALTSERRLEEMEPRVEAGFRETLQIATASARRLEALEQHIEAGLQEIHSRLDGIEQRNSVILEAARETQREARRNAIQSDDSLRDLLDLVLGRARVPQLDLQLRATRRVADDSPDHYAPRGTMNDNTRHLRFVRRCERYFPEVRHLDVGCAGGGLVWDFAIRGHLSVGIEGSDFSLRNCRAEWRTIPDRLFTADITQPFELNDGEGRRVLFNVITAWELFEHIPTDLVGTTIQNIAANLAADGMIVCSVATFVDKDESTGVVYHQTVKERAWWIDAFASHGLTTVEDLFDVEDFVRGSGNPRASDWNVRSNPEMGFHLVLRRLNSGKMNEQGAQSPPPRLAKG
jgi:2-polyprenyl-3-methyl-5-hydroxy-6-metoxy-1,4-benzoquinol methylase